LRKNLVIYLRKPCEIHRAEKMPFFLTLNSVNYEP